jgi:hypothetical protein
MPPPKTGGFFVIKGLSSNPQARGVFLEHKQNISKMSLWLDDEDFPFP